MKASNRKALNELYENLSKIKAELEDISNVIAEIHEEEEGIFDERSEKWQESEKGDEDAEKITALVSAKDPIAEIIELMDNLQDYIEEAAA